MAALTASYYGWVQISGKALGNCLTLFADNGYVYLTGTAGSIDDASVAGDFIHGAHRLQAGFIELENSFVTCVGDALDQVKLGRTGAAVGKAGVG